MEAEERIITSEFVSDDPDVTLRPKNFGDYVGQEKAKENLAIYIEAAKQRGEALDHVCCTARPDWEKPHFPISLPMNWGLISASHPVQLSKSQEIWRRF